MTVRIPYFYEATIRLPDGRRDERIYQDVYEFDSGSVLAADAPVVLAIKDSSLNYRFIAGSFYISSDVKGQSEERVFHAALTSLLIRENFKKYNHGDIKRRGAPNPENTARSDREETIEKLNTIFGSSVYVEGQLYVPCKEPTFIAKNGGLTLQTKYFHDRELCFSPNDGPVAELYDPAWRRQFDFESIRPEFFTLSFHDDRLLNRAASLTSHVAQCIGYMDEQDVNDFCEIRRASFQYRKEGFSPVRAIEAGRRLIRALNVMDVRPRTYGFDESARGFEIAADDWIKCESQLGNSITEVEDQDLAAMAAYF